MSWGVWHFKELVDVIQTASCQRQKVSVEGEVTFGVDQFSFGTTEPFRRDISRVNMAVKSARGSGSFSV